MSWSAESLFARSARALGLWVVLVSCAASVGCYSKRRCAATESCNYADDDCDYRYDEDFRDDHGRYVSDENCGGCGVRCADVFPTASATRCALDPASGDARCELVSCPTGFHRANDSLCVADAPALCLPCREDAECELRQPSARCVFRDPATGLGRCVEACGEACPAPLACATVDGARLCMPASVDFCTCDTGSSGQTFGCFVTSPTGRVCAGEQECTTMGLGACTAAIAEACNAEDDDCDGQVDEDFVDADGVYVSRMHCGGCGMPCTPPGPHMSATCSADPSRPTGARCDVACESGFVDVNGIAQDGCECQRWDGQGPPPAAGGDSDCDGVPDDSTEFVYVTTTGSDANPGTLAAPLRTIQAGLVRGAAEGKDVLVARGIYEGPVAIVGGVDVFGGYRPDFRDRSLTLFPVEIESTTPGAPALVCRGIRTATRVEGFTIQGSDALAAGSGSTAVFLDGCGPEVALADLVVYSGRGADGQAGASSSDNAVAAGLPSLAALDGADGSAGRPGTGTNATCAPITGGSGGTKACFGADVSGGAGGATGCPNIGCTNGLPCPNAGCTDYTVGGVCDFTTVLSLAVPNGTPGTGRGSLPGGAGELTYNAPTNRGICNFCDDNPTLARDGARGGDGAPGADGDAGLGCGAAPVLDPATGRLTGLAGTSGGAGANGSGGGGGSGGSGYAVIGGTAGACFDHAGGSGGGGGSGGCGAPRGDGGGGAGASVGIAIRLPAGGSAGPALERARIVTASGGAGGAGGIGAAGGTPGAGAVGGSVRFWCARTGGRGGDGGAGGAGGGGGGGCGGASHGIYLVSGGLDVASYAAALGQGAMVDATGVPGRGGLGGYSPGTSGTDGAAGAGDPIRVVP